MTNMLYPTRGGQSSYTNQGRVVEIAKEREAKLFFLYVSNVDFLGGVTRPALVDVVEEELDHMGEFLLAMAQERTANAGWKAEAITRRGDFQAALGEVIAEQDIDVLILGAPGKSHAVTTPKFLRDLIDSLVAKFNIEVFVLQDGKITEHQEAQRT